MNFVSPIRPPDEPGTYSYRSRMGLVMMAFGALGLLFREFVSEEWQAKAFLGFAACVLTGLCLVIRHGVRSDTTDLDKLR